MIEIERAANVIAKLQKQPNNQTPERMSQEQIKQTMHGFMS